MWKKIMAAFTTIVLTVSMTVPTFAGDMYRFYNRSSGEHFYTADRNEGANLSRAGWRYEGIGWVAPDKSKTPVYRLYNPNSGDHHYTINASERNSLVKIGWKYEGIGWYSDDQKKVPIYRQFNPKAKTGAHNFTPSVSENNALVRSGWRAEGVAWYGSAAGRAGTDVHFPTPVPTAAPKPATPRNSGGTARTTVSPQPTTQVVYWTPAGERYHSTRNCPTLKRSRTILSGSVSDAGGRTPCKVCF